MEFVANLGKGGSGEFVVAVAFSSNEFRIAFNKSSSNWSPASSALKSDIFPIETWLDFQVLLDNFIRSLGKKNKNFKIFDEVNVNFWITYVRHNFVLNFDKLSSLSARLSQLSLSLDLLTQLSCEFDLYKNWKYILFSTVMYSWVSIKRIG